MKIGIWLFGVSSIVAGVCDLIWREFEPAHQPIQAWGDHIPGITFFALIAALWLIVGGSTIVWQKTARIGGLALAILYAIFSCFPLPRLITAPHYLGHRPGIYIGVLVDVCQEVVPAIAGLVVFLALSDRGISKPSSQWLRWIFGLCSVLFGLNHLTGVQYTAPMVPSWIPLGGDFWAVMTGIAFILAGLAIIFGIRDVLAAWLLGWMLVLFSVFALIPPIFKDPHGHVAWGANAYNLAAAGAAWIMAGWLASQRRAPLQSSHATSVS